MNPTEYIDLDCSVAGIQSVQVSQYDSNSRTILIRLYNEGERIILPDTATVRIKMLKNDGHYILNDCIVEDNIINLIVDEQMTSVAGKSIVELLVINYPNAEVLYSTNFYIFVKESVYENSVVESTDEFKSLTDALIEFDTLISRIEILESEYADLEERVEELEIFATDEDIDEIFGIEGGSE